MRLGPDRLRNLCTESNGIEPDPLTAFLFTNRARDCLLLYSVSGTGDQTLMKKLDKGTFPLPTPDKSGRPFVTMRANMLARLFRSA